MQMWEVAPLLPYFVHIVAAMDPFTLQMPQVDGESCDGSDEFDHNPVVGGFAPEAPLSGDKLRPVLADLPLYIFFPADDLLVVTHRLLK